MSPNPDFGYDTYKGYGRLAGKVLTCHLRSALACDIVCLGCLRCCSLLFSAGRTDFLHLLKASGTSMMQSVCTRVLSSNNLPESADHWS